MMELGSLLITGIPGTVLSEEVKETLDRLKVAGIILFAHNYENPAQLAELINEIQTTRGDYPLFISVDHEGGRVMRFKKHFTQFPSMYELGCLNSPKLIFEAHSLMAKELRACGVNLSYSPVCDVWTNKDNKVIGDRAFGHDVDIVEKCLSAAIRGLQTNGVLGCAKHFPGHGDTLKDSHYDLPLIKNSLEQIHAREIKPFIKASRSRVQFMMMGHLQVDAIDEEFPTSLSEKAYSLLRSSSKFQHIVVTDDMEMKAIADRYSVAEASVMALNAGADIVMYRNLEDTKTAYQAIQEAYKSKNLKKEKVLQKLERITQVREEFLQNYKPIYIPEMENSFNSEESRLFLEKVSELKEKSDK